MTVTIKIQLTINGKFYATGAQYYIYTMALKP